MDDDVLEIINKQREFAERFPDYPCAKCKRTSECESKHLGKQCYKWAAWFGREWRKIRKELGKADED